MTLDGQTLIFTLEDPHGPVAASLLLPLIQELSRRYPEETADAPVPEGVASEKGAFVVAWHASQPVGCGALREMEPGVGEVKRMYVTAGLRRVGVGRSLLNQLVVVAVSLGYNTLRLETGIRQPEALALYESAAFIRMECYGPYAHNPFSVCFEKRLQES